MIGRADALQDWNLGLTWSRTWSKTWSSGAKVDHPIRGPVKRKDDQPVVGTTLPPANVIGHFTYPSHMYSLLHRCRS